MYSILKFPFSTALESGQAWLRFFFKDNVPTRGITASLC